MAAGTPPSLADVNNIAGAICRDIDMVFERVQIMQAWLLTVDLTAAPWSMLAADQATIKSAFSDLDQLRTIYQGGATLASTKDFRTFAARLHGPSL